MRKRTRRGPAARNLPTSAPTGQRREGLILAIIVLAGLALRGAYLAELVPKPDYDEPLADAQYNDYWARGIVTGSWTPPTGQPDPRIPTTPYFRPPGYAYFLAAVYYLTARSYLGPRLVQMAIGLLNIFLAFLVGRAVFHRVVGMIGAALVAAYWGFIYFEGELHPQPLLIALVLLFVLVLNAWARRPTLGRAAVAGFLLGLFATLQSSVLLFVPVLVLWAAGVLWRRGALRRLPLTALALLAALALPITPVAIRNYLVGHEFALISTNGGISLYLGNNPQTSLVTPRVPAAERPIAPASGSLFRWAEIVQAVAAQEGHPMTHGEASQYFMQRALEFIRAQPAAALGYALKRAALLWGPQEVSGDKVDALEHARSRTLRWLPGFPAVLAGFVVGLILWLADRRGARRRESVADEAARTSGAAAGLMLLFVLVYSASLVPLLVTGRSRVAYIPLLLLFAAYGLWRLGQFAAARRGWTVLVVVAGWAAAWGLASIPIVPYQPDLCSWYLDRATAYLQKGALEPAIAEYQAALQACPDNPAPYALLATALLQKGDVEGAIATHRRSVQMAPHAAAMRKALATLLRERNRLDEAIVEYQAALDLSPMDAETWYQLGSALELKGTSTDALSAYRRALDVDPTLSQVRLNVGVLLQKHGDLVSAIAEYRQAIESNPNLFEAHYNLAAALGAQGDLEGAYREISTALHIRPRHPTAQNLLKYLQQERLRASTRPAESRSAPSPSGNR